LFGIGGPPGDCVCGEGGENLLGARGRGAGGKQQSDKPPEDIGGDNPLAGKRKQQNRPKRKRG